MLGLHVGNTNMGFAPRKCLLLASECHKTQTHGMARYFKALSVAQFKTIIEFHSFLKTFDIKETLRSTPGLAREQEPVPCQARLMENPRRRAGCVLGCQEPW